MRAKCSVAVVACVAVILSAGTAAAEETAVAPRLDLSAVTLPVPPAATPRPMILPALYATLGAMQAWDIYTTRAALQAGAHEANPSAAAFAGNAGSLLALKAATTAGTIVLAERMWKKNKAGAIAMLVAVNGATAAVSLHNMRTARAAGRQ